MTVLAAALLPLLLFAPPGDKVIDVRARQAPAAASSFDALWAAYKRAESKGDSEATQGAMREIRRLRIERNIRSLETIALARVGDGVAALRSGETARAEAAFRDAVALDPHLPDAYFGLAQYDVKKGPLGLVPAVKDTLAGTMARLRTARGGHYLFTLLVPVMLLALLATTIVFGLTMVIRDGSLLKHDFEESFGPGRRSLALGLAAIILLLPAMLFQGWAWLPLWWLAMLFIYMGGAERMVALALILLCVISAPLVKTLESRLRAQQNPLFWASLIALEGGPDTRAVAQLEEAQRANGDDRDFLYLLGAQYKKAGRYEDGAALYREALRSDPKDPIALNNLANLEFAGGEFPAAIARYKQGIESGPPVPLAATFYYNLSLAHLQRFEYQPAQEAKTQADRLDSSLVHTYDSLWKYDKGDYAVVDLGLSADEVWAKFAGATQGIVQKNEAGKGAPAADLPSLLPTLANRLTVFPLVALLAIAILRRWRGGKAFTMRCLKCGTPFCRRCHLGQVAGGLCSQCHHLFVVRDGVSGPARNRKLLEVQKEEGRRDLVFRALSLLVPGAGHLYAHRAGMGIFLVFVWSMVLAAGLLTGRLLPLTEASGDLSKPWGLGVGVLVLLVVYVLANRSKPEFEDVKLPIRRAAAPAAARRRAS
ncbi:MAG TPA: tetratricopeptide repeat protein [Vicinamibacteria bacterium]|nr:tetratricopeptide repeat protein [Vicinamibacteria bacterium]